MGIEVTGASTKRAKAEYKLSKNPLPSWLRDKATLLKFRAASLTANNYADLAQAVGVSKNALCGAAKRAGGFARLLEAANVLNAETEARRILTSSHTYRAVREHHVQTKATHPRTHNESTQKTHTMEKARKMRDERIGTFKEKAEAAFLKAKESKESLEKVTGIAHAIENLKDSPNFSGVYLYRGRSVHRKNGQPITTDSPLESFVQIRFVTTGAPPNTTLDRVLIGAVQNDLNSTNSKILSAARRAQVGRVSVTAFYDRETVPIADHNVSLH